jgi:hypothetical protein
MMSGPKECSPVDLVEMSQATALPLLLTPMGWTCCR